MKQPRETLAIVVVGLAAALSANAASFVVDPAVDRRCDIVVPDDAIPAERTAAQLLARHLPKMLPEVSFSVVPEGKAPAGKRIFVGSTKALAAAGFDVSGWDVEEELVAARPEGLLVAGGRPRGARYAAADFLEALGVVVAADDTQCSPRLERIEWDRPDLRRRPAFRARYTATPPIRQHYLNEFNKYNGYRTGGVSMGGYASYGKYGDCHTFVPYSKDLPRDVPEVFAYVRGKRAVPEKAGQSAPLCPTNPKTLELFLPLLEADVRRSMGNEATNGIPRPRYYEISMDDNLTVCECPSCRRAFEEDGCYAGAMLRLINPLARRLAELDPAAKMTMLVYQKTLEFPKATKPESNVQPRICVHDNEWKVNVKAEAVEPITSAHNDDFRKTAKAWMSSTKSFGVWEYWEYYTKGDFPYLAPRAYIENMRYYKAHGAENILVEIEKETHSFFAFKNWLALKLMDDPQADCAALFDKFFAAYYGAAAKPMRKCFNLLCRVVEGEAAKAPMGPRSPMEYEYLDAGFFRAFYSLLAEAEAAAAGDERSLWHVRSEYITPDRMLLRRPKAHVRAQIGLGKEQLIARIRSCERRLFEGMYAAGSDYLKRRLARLDDYLAGESIEAPLPPEVKGESVFDFKYNSFYLGPTTRLVQDPDALGGKAVEVWGGENFPSGKSFHRLPLTAGIYNGRFPPDKRAGPGIELREPPQDEKYHLYHVGRAPLVAGSLLWVHWTWYMQFLPRDAYSHTPDYDSDLWVSIKVTGPTYVKGSTKPDGVFVDRVIVAR